MAIRCVSSPHFGKVCEKFRVEAPSGKIAAALGAILLLSGFFLTLAAYHVLPIGLGAIGIYVGLSGLGVGGAITSAVAYLNCRPKPDAAEPASAPESESESDSSSGTATPTSTTRTVLDVDDDGDCMFAAFNLAAQCADSTVSDPKAVREEAIEWIRAVFGDTTHPQRGELIDYLRRSMQDHFEAKAEQAEPATISDSTLEGLTPSLIEEVRVAQVAAPDSSANTEAAEALREKARKAVEDEGIEDLVKEYLTAMEQPGEYGGIAELFALSCKRDVTVVIYSKEGVELEPLNRGISEKKPRCFEFEGKHYSPIVDAA